MPGDALDVFISYSHEDKTLRRELEEQLVRLRREGLLGTWHGRQITATEEWRGWVDRDLRSADLILLIVSAPFLASDYCRDAEIKYALELQALGHAKVIPIIGRPCDWRTALFSHLATLPQGVGPVTEWHDRDRAWEDVGDGIREVATRLIAARLESTAEYRIAVLGPIRATAQPATEPPEEVSRAGTPRVAILGGLAAVLAALAAVLIFVLWRPQQSEEVAVRGRAAAVEPPGTEAGQGSSAAARSRPVAPALTQQPPAPPPGAAMPPEVEPDTTPQGPSPEESPLPEMETTPEELAPVTTDAEPATAAAEGDAPPAPATEPPKPEDFERSLGILAAAGAETEGECLAVMIADDYALTSRACAQAATVMVMGGNALTATRDEIFDLEPRPPSSQTTGVAIVKLLQGLGTTYGFAATRAEASFDHERLSAFYVEASAIRQAECVAVARLAEIDRGDRAYVENTTLDRYVGFVEEAADEVISIAGPQWAQLLPEMLDGTDESLGGFVCAFPHRPAGNLVISEKGHVAGIGYHCEPFDRLEPQVRDSLPHRIRRLDLDCIASLADVRERLSDR